MLYINEFFTVIYEPEIVSTSYNPATNKLHCEQSISTKKTFSFHNFFVIFPYKASFNASRFPLFLPSPRRLTQTFAL